MTTRATQPFQTHCEWLDTGIPGELAEPTSCGLDLWHSDTGLRWSDSYLHAKATMLRIDADSGSASIICQLRRLLGGFYLASAYPYGRINGDAQLFWQSISVVAKALKQKKIVRLEIPFTGPYIDQLSRASVSTAIRVPSSMDAIRHVLDMSTSSIGELDRRFDANARWAVRKALRNGCTVRHAAFSEIDTLQDFYARTMSAKHAPVHYGKERWNGIANSLAPSSHGSLYVGEIKGEPRGMAATVDGSVSRHLIQLAVPPDAHSSRLGELLVATAINDAHAKGLRYFDFMASPASDTGLLAFKAKWGTAAEPIRHAVIIGIPGLQRAVDLARWAIRTQAHFRAA